MEKRYTSYPDKIRVQFFRYPPLERSLQYGSSYVDHGAEITELKERIAELKEHIKRIEEELEKKPYPIVIHCLNSDRLELEMPLIVTIEATDQGSFVIWSEDLNTWGEGKSEDEAKENFFKNVEELYFDLKDNKDKLGPAMEKIWNFFQKIINEIQDTNLDGDQQ